MRGTSRSLTQHACYPEIKHDGITSINPRLTLSPNDLSLNEIYFSFQRSIEVAVLPGKHSQHRRNGRDLTHRGRRCEHFLNAAISSRSIYTFMLSGRSHVRRESLRPVPHRRPTTITSLFSLLPFHSSPRLYNEACVREHEKICRFPSSTSTFRIRVCTFASRCQQIKNRSFPV